MNWRLVILLLFFSIGQFSTAWAGKTTPFYVPPVMRLDLDPLQWELPYFQPWYFLAKSFEPHQMVEIKGRNFNLEITRKFQNHSIDFFRASVVVFETQLDSIVSPTISIFRWHQ